METTSDEQVQEYPYRLKQSGRAIEISNQNTISWIKEFREDDMANVMDYLLEKPSESPLTIKIAFGKLCFKLSSIRCKSSTIAWSELQKLRNFEEFMTRWSNYCSRSSPSITALMDDLESWMEKGVEPRKTLSVHLAGCKGGSYDLKYHLVQIKSFEAKSKVHVDANGLRFSIFYLDKHQDEFRLECRLATVEKEKLSTKDNEAQVLLMKVLEVLA